MFINRPYMRYVGVLLLCCGVFLLAILPTLANGRASTMAAEGLTLVTEDLSGSLTPDDLATALIGSGVVISNVTYSGVEQAAGTFSGGEEIIGFEGGIILGTGDIALVVGPNTSDVTSVANGGGNDSDLDNLSNTTTIDAAVLEFDFVPNQDNIFFQFVFTSEGYNEDVNTDFNDVFAFFVNGNNCAVVDGEPISINTINNGNPYGTAPNSHPELYINNDLDDGGGARLTRRWMA